MMMSTQLSLIFFNRTTKTSGGVFFWVFTSPTDGLISLWSTHQRSGQRKRFVGLSTWAVLLLVLRFLKRATPTHADAVQGTYLQFEVKILVLCFPSYLFPLLHMARKAKIIWNDPLTEVPRVKHYFLFQLFDAMPSWLFLRFYLF